MLEDIKDSLRVSGEDLNAEIADLIEGAKADLILSGVSANKVTNTDPLIKRAVILYCKVNFGYEETKIAERFLQSYVSLKNHLAISVEYSGGI